MSRSPSTPPSARSPTPLRRLDAVLVCVDYSDLLQYTLPYNIAHFDRYVVVTTSYDAATQSLAGQYGARLVVSDRCHEQGDAFNKGKMLNDGLAALDAPDWIVFTDADIFLPPGLPTAVAAVAGQRQQLFGTRRRFLPAGDEATIQRFFAQGLDMPGLREELPVRSVPLGYFQLWNAGADAVRDRWPRVLSEDFASAAAIDSWFHAHWPRNAVAPLATDPRWDVVHIPHGELGQNWNGRRDWHLGGWRFAGLIARHGIGIHEAWPPDAVLKLVGVSFDSCVEVTPAAMQQLLQFDDHGVIWDGRRLGEVFITLFWRPGQHAAPPA